MYEDYKIEKASDTGLMIVFYRGHKIGTSQTETAAKIIRRKHCMRNGAK